MCYIGVDLGGSHIGVGLVNEDGAILEKLEIDISLKETLNIEECIINNIETTVEEILKKSNKSIQEIQYIGIGCPGTISENKIIYSNNIKLSNFDLATELNKKIGIPVYILNDAKCAAIAEKVCGSIKNYTSAIMLTLGTGIGGAVILNNKLLTGKNYIGCELGHIVINSNGKQCTCGRKGCFETYGSMRLLKDRIKERLGLSKEISGKELVELIKKEENRIKIEDIIDEYAKCLAVGIGNLINIFEPEIVVLRRKFCLL